MGKMDEIFDTSRKTLQEVEQRLEMPRREFLQFCATLAATLGLPAGAEAAVAKAWYIVRRSGLHARPLLTVMPSITRWNAWSASSR